MTEFKNLLDIMTWYTDNHLKVKTLMQKKKSGLRQKCVSSFLPLLQHCAGEELAQAQRKKIEHAT